MLRLGDGQVECLWDEILPQEARALPEDLARLDEVLADPALLAPIEAHWRREGEAAGRSTTGHGRPTVSMQSYVRLMVVKHRTGWGYRRWCARCRTRCICGASA
jgi:IS5 family transposase